MIQNLKFKIRNYRTWEFAPMRFILIGLVFTAVAAIIGGAVFFYAVFINSPAGGESSPRVFIVESGQGVGEISRHLKEEGFIGNSFSFEVYVWLRNWDSRLKAGKYEFTSGVTVSRVARALANGDVIDEDVTVTVPEGFRLRQIEGQLREAGIILNRSLDSFKIGEFFGQEGLEYLSILPQDKTLEGFLFPDSYKFNTTQSDEDIIGKMLVNFNKNITDNLRRGIERQGLTFYEGVVLASILEREVPTYEDRKIVAGLLLKRMRYGMPLQVDASLTYVTGRGSLMLTKDDLGMDSPYNTYKYKGLPPTPISNPGTTSLWAVANAQVSPYWFYLSKSDGTTIFSRTFEEHVAAKNKYLR